MTEIQPKSNESPKQNLTFEYKSEEIDLLYEEMKQELARNGDSTNPQLKLGEMLALGVMDRMQSTGTSKGQVRLHQNPKVGYTLADTNYFYNIISRKRGFRIDRKANEIAEEHQDMIDAPLYPPVPKIEVFEVSYKKPFFSINLRRSK